MNETLGWNFILMGNLMKSFLNEEQQNDLESIKGDEWYPAEKLQELLKRVAEKAGEEKVKACGKGIYYAIKDKVEQMGVKTPMEAVKSIIPAYLQNNRGNSIGEWILVSKEEARVTVEDDTIYDCALGEGVLIGAIKAFGGRHVNLEHIKCRKRGDESCVSIVTWK